MMSEKDIVTIVIAETSPIISSGLNYCLHHLPGIRVHTVEADTCADIEKAIAGQPGGIIFVNPTFDGGFDPVRFKKNIADGFRIAAIVTGPIDGNTLKRYDGSLSIADNMNSIAAKVRTLSAGPDGGQDLRETLSQREKEIVIHVVKGMTNKEIADKLFLSVHTVITHRRNIARKLEIHSATGLTIYAIVNHLVDLSEIKL